MMATLRLPKKDPKPSLIGNYCVGESFGQILFNSVTEYQEFIRMNDHLTWITLHDVGTGHCQSRFTRNAKVKG